MCLINNDRVVGIQIPVMGGLSQQDAIGHELDQAVLAEFFTEANLITHYITQWGLELFRDAICHGLGSNSPGLGATDQTTHTATGLQAHFWNLGGFSGTGFTCDDQHLVLLDRSYDFFTMVGNGQLCVIIRFRNPLSSTLTLICGRGTAVDH